MRKILKMMISCLLLVLVTIVGTFLPSRLFEAEDERRQEQYQSYEMEPLVIQKTTAVPFEKKCNMLFGDSYYIRGMTVSGGQEERKRVKELVAREVKALKSAGALAKNLKVGGEEKIYDVSIYDENIRKCFVIDTSEPENAIYVWAVSLNVSLESKKSGNGKGTLYLLMDDETGKVFAMQMHFSKRIRWEKRMNGFIKYLSPEFSMYETYFENYMKELMYLYEISNIFTTISENSFGVELFHMDDVPLTNYDTETNQGKTFSEGAVE